MFYVVTAADLPTHSGDDGDDQPSPLIGTDFASSYGDVRSGSEYPVSSVDAAAGLPSNSSSGTLDSLQKDARSAFGLVSKMHQSLPAMQAQIQSLSDELKEVRRSGHMVRRSRCKLANSDLC